MEPEDFLSHSQDPSISLNPGPYNRVYYLPNDFLNTHSYIIIQKAFPEFNLLLIS